MSAVAVDVLRSVNYNVGEPSVVKTSFVCECKLKPGEIISCPMVLWLDVNFACGHMQSRSMRVQVNDFFGTLGRQNHVQYSSLQTHVSLE